MTLNSKRGVMLLHRRTPTGWRDMRWQTASMVFQGAMNALDPVMRIDRQIAEAIRPARARRRSPMHASPSCSSASASRRARRKQYPHEFSGGMRQRVMIALALACGPELIIGDEPTTALDVMTQGQILQLLEELRRDLGLALLLITHDLSVIAETCDRVAIMYAGQIVEQGPVRDMLASPQHPYTERLLAGFAHVGGPRDARRGRSPARRRTRASTFPGCRFAPRCHRAFADCVEGTDRRCSPASTGREARCLLARLP